MKQLLFIFAFFANISFSFPINLFCTDGKKPHEGIEPVSITINEDNLSLSPNLGRASYFRKDENEFWGDYYYAEWRNVKGTVTESYWKLELFESTITTAFSLSYSANIKAFDNSDRNQLVLSINLDCSGSR